MARMKLSPLHPFRPRLLDEIKGYDRRRALIGLSQLKDFLGLVTPKLPADFFSQIGVLAAQLHTTNLAALAIGAVSLAVVALRPKSYATPTAPTGQAAQIHRLAAHLPGTVVVLVGTTLAVHFLHLPVDTIGTRFGGIPATGTIARTVTNVRAGGTSPLAGVAHAFVLLAIVLLAAPLALHVPLAALAGILLFVAWNMGEWREFARLRRFTLPYRTILLGTFGLTVVFDLTAAMEVGLVLAAANEQPLSLIRRSGFEALLGADHDVPTLDAAWQLLSAPHPHPQSESPH